MKVSATAIAIAVSCGIFFLTPAAHALSPGIYECHIKASFGVKAGSGAKIRLKGAPKNFLLEIGEGPIFGDQLKEGPRRRTDVYEPESPPAMTARFAGSFFAKPADRLISYDRRLFTDKGASLVLSESAGEFVAYGEADAASGLGVAVYSGVCSPGSAK